MTWLMSALGQKQTSAHVRAMSALPPKADITGLLGQRERAATEARLDRVPWRSGG
jgi:hypothetical protein